MGSLIEKARCGPWRAWSSDLRRSVRNASFSSAEHVLHPLLWLLATPVYIAYLGRDLFGVWILVQSILGFSQLFGLGLTTATTKYVAKYRGRENSEALQRVIQTTGWIYMMLGAAAAAIVFLASAWIVGHVIHPLPEHSELCVGAVKLLAAGVFVRFFYSIYQSALQGFERHDLAARVGMIVNAITMVVNIALVTQGYSLHAMIGVVVVCTALGGCAMWCILRMKLVPGLSLRPHLDFAIIREVWQFGFFSGLRAIVSNAGQHLELFIVSSMLGATAVGLLGVARRLPLQVHALISNATAFLFPFTGALVERGDKERLRRVYDKASTAVVILVSGLLMPILLFGPDFLALWIDKEFADLAGLALMIYCVRYGLLPMTIVNHHYLLGAGLARLQAAIVTLTTVVTLLAVYVLTPRYGINGAAGAALVAFPVVFFTRIYVEYRIFGRASLMNNTGYYLPILVPLSITALFVHSRSPGYIHVVPILVGMVATAVVAWILSAGVALLLQRLHVLPSVSLFGATHRDRSPDREGA